MAYVLDHDIHGLNFCIITVQATRAKAGDLTTISVRLPPRNDWNGRFVATGGGGWASATFDPSLGQTIQQGFAAASTDAGHALSGNRVDMDPTGWALENDGSINWKLSHNFAGRSAHDMGMVGEAVAEAHFGFKLHDSNWSGCSNGGRQGTVVAQLYPKDFDGILAAAPAMNFPELQMASLWPQLVTIEEDVFPSSCELDFFVELAPEQCNALDGVVGVIQSIEDCHFDPFQAVGRTIQCGDAPVVISNATAGGVARTTDGPTLSPMAKSPWFGVPASCTMSSLAGTKVLSVSE